MSSFVFTHISKTAGTSLRKAVFDVHLDPQRIHRFTGVSEALQSEDEFDLLTGHCPYGVHWFYRIADPRYFVMLRDPIDRAVSHYHFVKSCNSSSYQHPSLDDVKEKSLVDFNHLPQYQNMQIRFIAGWHWQLIGRFVSLNTMLGKLALQQAKRNLHKHYEAFGLKGRFSDSAELFGKRVGVPVQLPERKYKKTRGRPTVNDLSDDVVHQLRASNALDVALYEYADCLFDSQL